MNWQALREMDLKDRAVLLAGLAFGSAFGLVVGWCIGGLLVSLFR